MGFFRLFGLALVVAAVDATTGRVTPQVRPPWSRGSITCDSATSTSHSTCLRYNYNHMTTEVVFISRSAGVRLKLSYKLQHEFRPPEHTKILTLRGKKSFFPPFIYYLFLVQFAMSNCCL